MLTYNVSKNNLKSMILLLHFSNTSTRTYTLSKEVQSII